MMRPRPARWFEVLCARQDVSLLLEALAATGAVELESRAGVGMPDEWSGLAVGLAEFHGWQARYGSFWPCPAAGGIRSSDPPARILDRALGAMRSWAAACEADIAALQGVDRDRQELALWLAAVRAWLALAPHPVATGSSSGSLLGTWLVDPGSASIDLCEYGLARELVLADGRSLWIVVAAREQLARLEAPISAAHGALLPAPAWLPQPLADIDAGAARQQSLLDAAEQRHRARLQSAAEEVQLAEALADLKRLDWITTSVRALVTTDLLAFVSGWTCAASGATVATAVAASGARALVHFPPAPAELTPPLLLSNPRWAAPFEIFSRAFGVPGRNEADPTAVVAVVAPLLFGYMFGDIGQGAVIVLAGWWWQRRNPFGRLAVSAGLASMLFGWVYGSVFALEHLVAPLWLHPLEQPLQVLAIPVLAGAVLLLFGLGLNALGAWWRGRFDEWLRQDAGGVLVYLGLLLTPRSAAGVPLAMLGVLWTASANLLHAPRLAGAVAALGQLLERTLQLLVNTLSFARVGAFALAHAGLSSAVVALVDASGHGASGLIVLILGNVVMLVLEAMVVSIQTTRLVLFEFFTRFLTGAGRVFVPLPPPPSITREL